MNDKTITELFENYMECGYDTVTIYLSDSTYHTFELYNTLHRYNIQDGLLRITKLPQKMKWGEMTKKQEITIFIDKIEKIITKE